jgi:hypothetical protein
VNPFSEDQLASIKCDITKSNNLDEETESIEGDKVPKPDEEAREKEDEMGT